MTEREIEIEEQLAKEFPEYLSLARPNPLHIRTVQSTIAANEVLLAFLVLPQSGGQREQTVVWAVGRNFVRWARSDLGQDQLTKAVAALRCGLDVDLWVDEVSSARCRELVLGEPKRDRTGAALSQTLPFDVARAHAVYKSLFGQIEDVIRGKDLLIVPSGPLEQLPFHVLATNAAKGDYRAVAWLARRHAISVLPMVSSLTALRQSKRPSGATKPMLGVGNPLLDGDPVARPPEAELARLARSKQACPQTAWERISGQVGKRRSVRGIPTPNGRADLAHLKSQMPLHETADELCAVAKDLRVGPRDILLGANATEANIKQLNLADYRVLHFATHGTVAGEIEGTREPGLILTPPLEQTDLDDGYLSASEVATLKLDADWVILSACNTAAGGAEDAEALSGLARAFLYAGARALLVSHWAVDSAATVKLVTGTAGALTKNAKLGRAEALRRAMLNLIDKGETHKAHPAFWAPFVVVGEGGAPRR